MENEGGGNGGGEGSGGGAQRPAQMQRPDQAQRRRLVIVAGACAAGGTFIVAQQADKKSWPRGAPLGIDLTGLPEGKLKAVIWQDLPLWLLRRSPAEQAALVAPNEQLADPDSLASLQPPYARNAHRSLRPDLFVAIGLCTHQGCTPALAGDHFLCPCHTSKYDLAGRVVKTGLAPANLVVPAYRFDGENRVVIGEDA